LYRNTKSIDSAIRHLGKQYPPPALPRPSARPPPFPPKHLILLVNSKNSEVGFRKHFILLVNPVNPVILHLLEYFFWPRARARGARARARWDPHSRLQNHRIHRIHK